MPRKRHSKRQSKTRAPASLPGKQTVSPTAQAVADKIAQGGSAYVQENFIHVMRDSYRLAEEPEFLDLNFDGDRTDQVTDRWLEKYHKRLKAAEKKGPAAFAEVRDEMRIQVVDELVTPTFREEVNRRLEALLSRLIATDEAEKLEMALLLGPLLKMKDLPWGVCGLIVAIYQRTLQKTMPEYEEEHKVFGDYLDALKTMKSPADLLENIGRPEQMEQLEAKLAAMPKLRQRLEEKVWEIVKEFEMELFRGQVALDLFTQEELLLPYTRMQTEFGEQLTQTLPVNEVTAERLLTIIRQVIREIMTPERQQRLRNDVQATARAWLRERQKWGAALQAELTWLENEYREENLFLVAAFMGQMRRLGEGQGSDE
jgi:hypothetical protein